MDLAPRGAEDRGAGGGGGSMKGDVRETWDAHWARLAGPASTFGRISSLVRDQVLSRAVLSYAERYLPRQGVLVEMGCGSAESSRRIRVKGRRLVALDFSAGALRQATAAGVFGSFVQGDLERLPFGSTTIDGAWNLGVLEHFDQEKGIRILAELKRVLKPGGTAVLF
ncbi:class I SAM-dependent methyltransferase, partial [bacterium]|nr:class I SAM-dependent methyltransferase [bacterium]